MAVEQQAFMIIACNTAAQANAAAKRADQEQPSTCSGPFPASGATLRSFGAPVFQPSPLQRPGHYGHRLLDGFEIAAASDHLVKQGDGPFGAGEIVGHAEWPGSAHGS